MLIGFGVEHFSSSKVVHYQRDLRGVSYNSCYQYDDVSPGNKANDKEANEQGDVKKEHLMYVTYRSPTRKEN